MSGGVPSAVVTLLATNSELLGGHLPTKPIGWIGLAGVLLASVSGFLLALYLYLRLAGGKDLKTLKSWLEGLALPIAWVLWSGAFLYAEVTLTRVLIAGGGLVLIAVAGLGMSFCMRKK
ncbi:MAG: hypothetical protein WA687_08315 [Solirubrobacterales bacterium]